MTSRLYAILKALARAFQRSEKSFSSLAGNNFFLVAFFLGLKAGGLLYLIIGLVMLFPLATDPLRKIPPSRLALWPLPRRDLRLLRVLSPWLNPISWAVAALAIWALRGSVTFGLWGLAAGLVAAGFVLSDLPFPAGSSLFRRLPHFPTALDQLIRKNLRQIFCTLDFYCALLLALASLLVHLPQEANMAMTLLVVLALSSYAQCLFGLDTRGGLARYSLLPIPRWKILLAKDIAFLLIAIPLSLPLDPIAGLAASLIALAMGHPPSVDHPRPQTRWRFSAGASLTYGIAEVVVMSAAVSAVTLTSRLFLIPCLIAWSISLWWYSRHPRHRDAGTWIQDK